MREAVRRALNRRTVGARLREARKRAGLTSIEVAKIIGVSPAAVSHWENARRATPYLKHADAIERLIAVMNDEADA